MRLTPGSATVCTLIMTLFFAAGCCDRDKIPRNIDALYSSNVRERNQAALDLSRCGSRASAAVPRLGELLYDQNVGMQSAAAYALTKIDTGEARALMDEAKRNRKK